MPRPVMSGRKASQGDGVHLRIRDKWARIDLVAPLWERQPGETEVAFKTFIVYRDMGPGRSIRKAADLCGKNRSTLDERNTRFRWSERVFAYDRHMDRVAMKEREKVARDAARKSVERHATQSQALLEGLAATTEALLRRIVQLGGTELAFRGVSTGQLAGLVTQAARAYPALAKVERLSRGLPETVEQHDVTVANADETEEEMLARLATLRDKVAQRRLALAPAASE